MAASKASSDEQSSALEPVTRDKVLDWLRKEGLPTEYKTANIFRKQQFQVRQGSYVEGEEEGKMREVDVLASSSLRYEKQGFLRVSHVVECKWSKQKPWVVFTSPSGIAPAACISQTYGSDLGQSLLWMMAGDKALHRTRLFHTPDEAGFGGRQAHSSGSDHFYTALRGVTSKALSYLRGYDRRPRGEGKMPLAGVIAFPVIVVEGPLFRASFDPDVQGIKLEEIDDIRCHWRGANGWPFHSSVDIVTMGSLEDFVRVRASETTQLLEAMRPLAEVISRCCKSGSLEELHASPVSRGVVGLPKLLNEVSQAAKGQEKGR